MNILIVGAGPAGLALAAALRLKGLGAVVVEKAPENRTEGYAVGLHVNGWNVAQRLGVLEQLKARALSLGRAEYRDPRGSRLFSYDYRHLAAAAGGKMLAIMRDAVQDVLLNAVRGHTEIRFGTTVRSVSDRPDGVDVSFSDGTDERFDVVVAADGYRSAIRAMHFGPHEDFLRPLGYRAAAWRLPLDAPLGPGFVGMMDVDLQGGLYAVGDGTAAALFCWRDPSTDRMPAEERRAILEERFGGWAAPVRTALAAEIDWERGFFDTISQVEMPAWSKGRVVLLGDAAWCLTFLSGQGTSAALAGAYILASKLAVEPYPKAFHDYEAGLRPMITRLQAASRRIGGHYVPESRIGMRIQSWVIPALLSRPLAPLVARRMMAEELELDPA